MTESPPLKRLGLIKSTAIFLIPSFLTFLLYVPGRESVVAMGYEPRTAFFIVGSLSFAMLLLVAAWLYLLEGNRVGWSAIKQRLRLKPMTRKQWVITLLLTLFMVIAYLGLMFLGTREWIAQYIPVAAWYSGDGEVNSPMLGAYWIIWARLGMWVLNILGEELLWRGMLLPRQEVTHGRWAWLIHGSQWTLYHGMKPWELIMLLPGCLALAAVCQWSKSSTPGIVAHGLFNLIPIVLVTLVVFGVIG